MKTRVLVVEDSLIFREILVRCLNMDPEIEVIDTAGDPYEARDKIILHKPDVMTLDIELPRMDGLEFLRKLIPQYPQKTVVVSSLSEKVFDALHAGAVDFVAKPSGNSKVIEDFVRNELVVKVKAAAKAKIRRAGSIQTPRNVTKQETVVRENHAKESTVHNFQAKDINANVNPAQRAIQQQTVIAIGASTGGTEATVEVLKGFGADIPGVLVTQHMPPGFTKMYAERLNQRNCDRFQVKEAQTGDVVRPGLVLIAPGGDAHMEVVKMNGQLQVVLKKAPKVNGHCPSVEVLFNSVAREVGANAIGIILTGMGGDGAKGLLNMKNAGAKTIGQDESTCVVYGMPRVAYEMGAVQYQEKLGDIAKRTYQLLASNYRKE